MKHFLFFSLILLSSVWASANTCMDSASEYIIQGDAQASGLGARTWNLIRLGRDAEQRVPCSEELFERAKTEARDYWNHISEKYNCGESTSDTTESTGLTCSDEKRQTVEHNLSYVRMIENAYPADGTVLRNEDGTEGRACTDDCQPSAITPPDPNIQDLARVVVHAQPAPVDDICADVPAADRRGNGDNLSAADVAGAGIVRCIKGLFLGIFQDNLMEFVRGVWDVLSSPWQFLKSLGDLARAMITDPVRTLRSIVSSFVENYTRHYENFECFNERKRTEIICRSIGQGGTQIALIIFGPGVVKNSIDLLRNLRITSGTARTTPRPTSSPPPPLPPLTAAQLATITRSFNQKALEVQRSVRTARFELDAQNRTRLLENINQAPTHLQPAYRQVLDQLHNSDAWGNYLAGVIREAGQDMARSPYASIRNRALSGELSRNDVLRVLVKRSRARGESFSAVTTGDADTFFQTVRSGPFFDKYFQGGTQHGIDTHLIQRDFIAGTVDRATSGRPSEFYRHLSEGGRPIWDDMFDSFSPSSPTSPEYLKQYLNNHIPVN